MDIADLKPVGECLWEIPCRPPMRVPARFFSSETLVRLLEPKVIEQTANVAVLPGIVKASLVMPDAHWGYGFPIGGVAAFDPDHDGVISVGGIGYDISCGVRTMRTGLNIQDVLPKLEALTDALFKRIPAGVGSKGLISLSPSQLDDLLTQGARWAVGRGFGTHQDLEFIEDRGCTPGADPALVSDTAKKRQEKQTGTLGSGNHYLEIQVVEEIFDHFTAEAFGLQDQDVLISLHCGSRALGHQIGTDSLQHLAHAAKKYNIPLPERELVCAPVNSPEGRSFYRAMVCGINCALANRQVIGHLVQEEVEAVLPGADCSLLYDISHNTCKIENHQVQGRSRQLYVHRKGATRAFGPGHPELPRRYAPVGQPVLIGGTMGTSSYILAGNTAGEDLAWSSACHGAGRTMSRRQALKKWKGQSVIANLSHQGILLRTASARGAAEEAPQAYKDVFEVVESTHRAGLARKIARVRPLACIKG